MKYLEKFKMIENKEHITFNKEDADLIQNSLYIDMKEDGVEKDDVNWIYNELELIKKDADNSCLFHIIRNYYKLTERNTIIRLAIKFFDLKYKDVIEKFKKDRKKEFASSNNFDTEIESEFVNLPYGDSTLSVPRRIGHNYIPIKILPLEQLNTKFSKHRRLKVFHHKGLECISCPKIGEYLIAARDRGGAIHIDLYTKDFELMTIDHIKPKGKGGSNDIENLDPMCQTCNSKKADTYEEENIL